MEGLSHQIYFLQGIFNGLLLMMLLYNLFLFVSLRDKSYLYYVLYVFFTMISMLQSYGLVDELILSGVPEILSNLFIISMAISYIFYLALMRVFVGPADEQQILYKSIGILLKILIVATPIMFIAICINTFWYEIVARTISVLFYIPIMVILFKMFKLGNKLARYFVYGSLALFTGIAYILTTVLLGFDPNKHLYGFQLGVIAQVFIFSMGLSFRYEQMKHESIQAKYQALKGQIDPHFFFNSLSVLSSLVYKDPEKSAEYVSQLSKVYRSILDKSNESLVQLGNELNILDSYIFLMKIRFGDNIFFSTNISEKSRINNFIPPNTLQLLVENAIKHNKCTSDEPLNIDVFDDENFIYVKNNINRRNLIDENTGIGLKNIKHRYELLEGKKIVVTENNNTFMVALPKYNRTEYESINI